MLRFTLLWCVIEIALDMQIRAKLLQRTLGGGGNRGLLFSGTVKPIVSLPMVICSGRLVAVGSILPGEFFFVFWQICCFGGPAGVRLGIWAHPKKRPMGILPWVPKTYPDAKNRAPGVENCPF